MRGSDEKRQGQEQFPSAGRSGRLSDKRWDLNGILKGERNEMLSFHASPLMPKMTFLETLRFLGDSSS